MIVHLVFQALFADLVEAPPKQPSLIATDDENADEVFAQRTLDAIAAAAPNGSAAIKATATEEVKETMKRLKLENRRIYNRVDEAYDNAIRDAMRREGGGA